MREEGSNWDLMKGVILSVPPGARTTVVEFDDLRELLRQGVQRRRDVRGGQAPRRPAAQAARVDGGRGLQGRLDQGARRRRSRTSPSASGVYYEKLAQLRILKMSDRDRAALAKQLGGTPDQQLSLFQNDVPIKPADVGHAGVQGVGRRLPEVPQEPARPAVAGQRRARHLGPLSGRGCGTCCATTTTSSTPTSASTSFWEAFGDGSAFSAPRSCTSSRC